MNNWLLDSTHKAIHKTTSLWRSRQTRSQSDKLVCLALTKSVSGLMLLILDVVGLVSLPDNSRVSCIAGECIHREFAEGFFCLIQAFKVFHAT